MHYNDLNDLYEALEFRHEELNNIIAVVSSYIDIVDAAAEPSTEDTPPTWYNKKFDHRIGSHKGA